LKVRRGICGIERNLQDAERERLWSGFNSNNSGPHGGFREERPRYEQQRSNPNKRQFEDRERLDWDEQEPRAKFKKGQDEHRSNEQSYWNRQREET
jgi:hypothetical protein